MAYVTITIMLNLPIKDLVRQLLLGMLCQAYTIAAALGTPVTLSLLTVFLVATNERKSWHR